MESNQFKQKESVLTSVGDIKTFKGYAYCETKMENGDLGNVSVKEGDIQTLKHMKESCIGKKVEYSYEERDGGKNRFKNLSFEGETAVIAPVSDGSSGGGGNYKKGNKSNYWNDDRKIAIDEKKLEFETGLKQRYISYSVALEQANKLIATTGSKADVKTLLEISDSIFDHMVNKVPNE